MKSKSIDLGAVQDILHLCRKSKARTRRALQRAHEADTIATDELNRAQAELDAAYHAVRNQ